MAAALASVLILIPWFGPWPPWMRFFIESCRWNSTINWLLIGDKLVTDRRCRATERSSLERCHRHDIIRRLSCAHRVVPWHQACLDGRLQDLRFAAGNGCDPPFGDGWLRLLGLWRSRRDLRRHSSFLHARCPYPRCDQQPHTRPCRALCALAQLTANSECLSANSPVESTPVIGTS